MDECVQIRYWIHMEAGVRTNIELDDELVAEAMAATGLPTKRATVEEALRALVLRHRRQAALANLAGLGWQGNLDAMRGDPVDVLTK
jgi:Arc/MetJ family transcription regulator